MSIGNNIRKIRESKKITIDQISKKIGVFKKTYQDIERGLVILKPNSGVLKKISIFLNISISEIINYKEEIFQESIRELDNKNLKDISLTSTLFETSTLQPVVEEIITPITKTPINVVLEDLSVKEVIYRKPKLLTSNQLLQIGNKIKTVDVKEALPTDTFINKLGELDENLIIKEDRSFSSKLLNFTEPYVINGVNKTLFYSEINTSLKVGDRVFIINGNFDSNKFLKENKYKSKNDGYKVLFVDKCRVVLDIDFIDNKLPYKNQFLDDFINVYLIERKGDFLQANRQITTRGQTFSYKFNAEKNNIIYVGSTFSEITSSWGTSSGINQPGFYVKRDNNNWSNITNDFITGSFSIALGDYDNNGKVRINNGNFTFSVGSDIVNFNEGFVYQWKQKENGEFSWILDNEWNEAFITKSNFRKGDFNGTFNSGLYGTQDLRIEWDNDKFTNAVWNTGVLLNTKWLSGEMNSKNSLSESFFTEFDTNNKPYQKINAPNNNGNGYNIIENSTIESAVVENGTFNNSILIDTSPTYSIVEKSVKNEIDDINFKFTINKGLLNRCNIKGGYIKEADVINSRILNTRLENIKSINSNYKLSLISNSIYLTDDIIKILSYDEFSIKINNINDPTHKIYKFYISENDYKSIKIRDRFYIKGLLINDNSKYPLNFFDRRFRLSSWTEYFDSYKNNTFIKRGVEVGAFLSTPGDNDSKLNYLDNNGTIITGPNPNKNYSIDIIVSIKDIDGLEFTPDGVTNELPIGGLSINTILESGLNPTTRNIIDITNAYIVNSDFESGIIENTDWISGNHINYNNDVNLVESGVAFGTYSIIANTFSSELLVKTGYNSLYKESGDDCLEPGNIVFLNNVEWQSPNGESIKLGDTWEILENTNNDDLRLLEIGTTTLQSITQSGGTFSTKLAQNRYNYIFKAKISKSKISSGIFRRSYLNECFIENELFDLSDKDFNNISSIKSLVISDSIFKNNSNILSKALYMNSSFVEGSDKFERGIVYNSIWNGLTFTKGVFKESRWVNGNFNGGLFYNNRSFDGATSSNALFLNNERVKSYYKDGVVTSLQSNNRYSWQDGQFNNGDFFESDWENGNFNGGKFYYSKFYTGIINGGIIGDLKIPINNTVVYDALINFTTVDNARIVADNNFTMSATSSIIWNNGVFNNGEFGSNPTHFAVWKNGEFNSGNFENFAKWENGKFNGGKFLSTIGWTMSDSSDKADYTWQGGEFNGGQFGNGNINDNSTWFNGQFNGGKFIGRVWNNGILTNGEFIGSATFSAIRGVTATQSNALFFTDGFTSSYYGLWRNGVVSDKKDTFIKDEKIFTELKRSTNDRLQTTSAVILNSLWLSGTFSHSSGIIENSVWLNGTFEKGIFFKSSFNPFVKRNMSSTQSFELSDSCYWVNGELIDSDFYISKWEKGRFDTGDAYGMIWKDGVCNYMNAFNIFWEKGLWRNGNWYGSYIDYNGIIDDEFFKEILNRGISWGTTQSMHIWNVFENDSSDSAFSSANAYALVAPPGVVVTEPEDPDPGNGLAPPL